MYYIVSYHNKLANLINVVIIDVAFVKVDVIVHVFASFFIDFGCEHTTVNYKQYNSRVQSAPIQRMLTIFLANDLEPYGKQNARTVHFHIGEPNQLKAFLSVKAKAA